MYKLPINIENFSYKNIPELSSKRIIVRACLNADVDDSGRVIDATRIKEAIEGIKYFAGNAKQVIILAHLGRPEKYSKELSFWNVAEVLENELGEKVEFVPFQTDSKMEGKIILGDNVRFFVEEESKDLEKRMSFAKELAALGDIFVNDAFPDYRESASTYDIATLLPSFIGPKFLKEIEALSRFSSPQRPFVAVLGGAKLSEKLDALQALAESADKVIVGGAMAYTLLKTEGVNIGSSKIEEDKLDVAKEIMEKFRSKLILPVDHFVSKEFSEESANAGLMTDSQEISDGIGIDIGPKTIELFKNEISKASSILWNGPMGVFEWSKTEGGTRATIQAIIDNQGAYELAGGGDSIAALNKFHLSGFDHVSTGGGAMLAFLAYDKFPTLDVILSLR